MTREDYKSVVKVFWDLYDQKSAAGRERMAGCLARFAGHDLMDFRLKPAAGATAGGADGCVNFADGSNDGIRPCIVTTDLQLVYDVLCSQISLADFVVIGAEAMFIRASPNFDPADPFKKGSLGEKFMLQFRYGRTTLDECPVKGLMPDAEQGCKEVKKVFVDNVFKEKKPL